MKTSIIASLFGGRGANYLKITLAVLRRRKFFTFISLFGICFTLTILVVVTAFIDHLLAAGYPETERERSMYALMLEERDTKNQGASSGPMSFWFINKYIKSLKTPEKVALTSMIASSNTYINNQKIRVFFKYTDGAFWEIHQFKFVEGKAFTQKDIDNNEFVVVINEDLRDKYFGKGIACVGKSFEMDSQTFRVIGVVKGVPITRIYTSADVYLPYNTTKKDLKSTQHRGDYIAIVLAKNQTDMPLIQAEYNEVARRIKPQQSGTFKPDVLKTSIDGYLESFLRGIFRDNENATRYVYGFLVLFALLFMSLPAINLVNINMSRIMERSSEIGVRKAFGASSKVLTGQFVFENIILTLIGGVLAIVVSGIVISYLNYSSLIPDLDLTINWKVLLIAILLSLIFGLLSGVYPAWRMSKLQVVDALKA